MANHAHTTTPSRRLFLAAGSAAAVFGSLHAAAAPVVDPIFPALEAVAAARAVVQAACDHLDLLEERHPDVAWYRPRVQVGTRVALCIQNGSPGREEPVYAYTEQEIGHHYFSADREANIAARTQELQADIARHQAEEKAAGLTDARAALARALERQRAAERAALANRPSTAAGASALAVSAANYLNDEHDGEHLVAGALRHIAEIMRLGLKG